MLSLAEENGNITPNTVINPWEGITLGQKPVIVLEKANIEASKEI